jgi:hypothetical protein
MSAVEHLAPQQAAERLIDAHSHDPRWLDAFADAFEQRRSGAELARVLTVWDLGRAEAGRLFGVTRQAIAKWIDKGVPPDRAAEVADVAAATDLLVRYLRRDRIPAVVRRRADALHGRSLLDMLAAGDTAQLLASARAMFDFAEAHT